MRLGGSVIRWALVVRLAWLALVLRLGGFPTGHNDLLTTLCGNRLAFVT